MVGVSGQLAERCGRGDAEREQLALIDMALGDQRADMNEIGTRPVSRSAIRSFVPL